ncbi:MAG: cyclic nucleotide-binding domain-containing protein [Candidatus Sericytochromatia bacterium]
MQQRTGHIRDRELLERLLAEKLLTSAQIQSVISAQARHYQESQTELSGQIYDIQLDQHVLEIRQSLENTQLNRIELSPNQRGGHDWQIWARQLLLLDPQAPEIREIQAWLPGQRQGLVMGPAFSYLAHTELSEQRWVLQTQSLLDPRHSQEKVSAGPYDLFVDAGQQLVCLCDRASGDVWLIDPYSHEVTDIFSLGADPKGQALLLAPDPQRRRVLCVNQESTRLTVLDYREGTLEEYDLQGQTPMQVVLGADRAYLLIKAPQPRLVALALDTLQELASQDLPAAPYESLNAAAAPLVISPDGARLATVIAGDSPELIWLDAHSLDIIARQPLPGQPSFLLLAWAVPNPLLQHRRKLTELLLEAKLIDVPTLERLFPPPVADDAVELEIIAPVSRPAAPAEAELNLLDWEGDSEKTPASEPEPEPEPEPETKARADADDEPPRPVLKARPLAAHHAPEGASLLYLSPIERLNAEPDAVPADNLPLPQDAVGEILQILTGAFYQQHGIDLAHHPEALERLQAEAERARVALQDHALIPVDLPDLLPEERLRTVLLRESILTLLELRRTPERFPYDTPPDHCPECHAPLLGRWDCEACGQELLNPERARARKQASATDRTWLPPGFFAVPDVQSGRLLLVNTHKFNYVTWQLDFRHLPGAQQPWDMLWLQDLHVLVTDKAAARVQEVNPAGRVVWELERDTRAELSLQDPVMATCSGSGEERLYLIVDQGQHRVFQVNRRQQITWQFGQRGTAGHDSFHLNSPSHAQLTHQQTILVTDTGNDRVLEVRHDKIERTFGSQLKLLRPVFAQRLFNGHTLIADAGNYRLLEVDAEGDVLREVIYFKAEMDERFDMAQPLKVVRRENQNVVLIDANRVMEIDMVNKQIVWFSFLHELRLDLNLLSAPRVSAETPVVTGAAFERFNAPDPARMPTLRRTLQKIQIFADAPVHFFDALEAALHFRSYKAGELIVKRGQMGHSLFVLQSGKVEVLNAHDEPTLLLEQGDSFGLMGIIFKEPRKASIRCHEDCGVYILDKRDFDPVVERYPTIAAAVKKMASERFVLSKLRQTPKSHAAASRLQVLIDAQKERTQARLAELTAPLRKWTEPDHSSHRLHYSEIERHVIESARAEGLNCLELHITLRRDTRMKAARVALIASVLDRIGTLIRTEPSPEAILDEQIDREVMLALLTAMDPSQVTEEVCTLSDVQNVALFEIAAPAEMPAP